MKRLFLRDNYRRNEKGFTLIELVMAIAIIAMLFVAVAIVIKKARAGAKQTSVTEKMRVVIAGLGEYKMYKGSLPRHYSFNSWPSALSSYIEPELRNNTPGDFRYYCSGNYVQLLTPVFDDYQQANDISTKMRDMGLCQNAWAYYYAGGYRVNCWPKDFYLNAGC